MKRTDIFTYYHAYMEKANANIQKYEEIINKCRTNIEKLKIWLFINAIDIERLLNVNLEDYDVYNHNKNKKDDKLLSKVGIIKETPENKEILVNIRKLGIFLEEQFSYNNKLQLLYRTSNLTFKEYKEYVKRYYYRVQEEVLDGNGYQFSNNIGKVFINRVKNTKGKDFKKLIDYKKTKENKERLIEEGKTLYNKQDADKCKAKGIYYDGVEYIVYLNNDYLYELVWADSTLKNSRSMKMQRMDLHGKNIRHLSDDELLHKATSIQDIYNYDIDLMNKLQLILKFNPANFVKFIRNNEQLTFNHKRGNG